MTTLTKSLLDELSWRGLLYQTTAEQPLRDHLGTPGRIAYCGFDPTADSLTIGNLIPMMLLRHWQRCGHQPIVVMGGGTGLIGDPSGKDQERQLLSAEAVEHNVQRQRSTFERVLDFDPTNPRAAVIHNNVEWLSTLGFLEVLRDVGKHFSVNTMIQKDSVRERLHEREQGISYTEFSYMILQAYDFLHLRQAKECTVQIAGSDQFGNIVAGIDLIHRRLGHEAAAFGITAPLVCKADGQKIGKTETGAVWLAPDRTSPYAFYQFWINTDDNNVINYLKWFTVLDEPTIDDLARQQEAAPHERAAQRALADHCTEMIHGQHELERARAATAALFSGDVRQLDAEMLAEVFADVAHTTHDRGLLAGDGVNLVDMLIQTALAKSKREAREFIGNGAISINGQRAGADATLTTSDLLPNATILLRRGKKNWHATRWG